MVSRFQITGGMGRIVRCISFYNLWLQKAVTVTVLGHSVT